MKKYIFILIFFFAISNTKAALFDSLTNIKSWGYQLTNIDPVQLANDTLYDLFVIDYSKDGSEANKLTPSEIAAIKSKGKKVIAYLSIGEAENYRYYWQTSWNTNPPVWLGPENPLWQGNFKVKYWYPEWQTIIDGYLDKILAQGFDGVYLDIIDAYYYWEFEDIQNDFADSLMIQFVLNIRKYVDRKRNNTEFIIVPQNGEDIITQMNVSMDLADSYMSAINAVGVENIFFDGVYDEDNNFNYDSFRISVLTDYQMNGKPILSIEYLTKPAKIQQYLDLALSHNYIPYYCYKKLDVLCGEGKVSEVSEIKNNNCSIYPNPAKDNLVATFSTPVPEFNYINVYSLNGRKIRQINQHNFEIINPQSIRLNVSDLSDGVYLFELKSATATKFFKAVVKK